MEPSNSSNSNIINVDDSLKQDCENKPKNTILCGNTAKTSSSGRKVVKVWRLKKDSIVKSCTEEPSVALDVDNAVMRPVRIDISAQQKFTSSSKISVSQDNPSSLPKSEFPIAYDVKSGKRWRLKNSAGPCNSPGSDGATFSLSSKVRKAAVIPRKGRNHFTIPLRWWFGFSRSYEDGRAGEEGRTCHVLSEIEFGGAYPDNWYSDAPLSDWDGIGLHPGIFLIDRLDISRCRSSKNFKA